VSNRASLVSVFILAPLDLGDWLQPRGDEVSRPEGPRARVGFWGKSNSVHFSRTN